jgi:hypothetical protein
MNGGFTIQDTLCYSSSNLIRKPKLLLKNAENNMDLIPCLQCSGHGIDHAPRSHQVIVFLTVQEILDEHIAKKLV